MIYDYYNINGYRTYSEFNSTTQLTVRTKIIDDDLLNKSIDILRKISNILGVEIDITLSYLEAKSLTGGSGKYNNLYFEIENLKFITENRKLSIGRQGKYTLSHQQIYMYRVFEEYFEKVKKYKFFTIFIQFSY